MKQNNSTKNQINCSHIEAPRTVVCHSFAYRRGPEYVVVVIIVVAVVVCAHIWFALCLLCGVRAFCVKILFVYFRVVNPIFRDSICFNCFASKRWIKFVLWFSQKCVDADWMPHVIFRFNFSKRKRKNNCFDDRREDLSSVWSDLASPTEPVGWCDDVIFVYLCCCSVLEAWWWCAGKSVFIEVTTVSDAGRQ